MEVFLVLSAFIFICSTPMIHIVETVQFPMNPTPEVPHDDKNLEHKRETELKTELNFDKHEEKNKSNEESKDLLYLEEALQNVLDPSTVIVKEAAVLKRFEMKLLELENENNETLEGFFNAMDELSLDVCVKSQEALWSYVNDVDNEGKKKYMLNIVKQEEEIKRKYWQLLKERYTTDVDNATDSSLKRRIYRIRNRDINAQISESEERKEINEMQRIWSLATVCPYNVSSCAEGSRNLSVQDLNTIFVTSDDTEELTYYWKSYRDATGRKIRPLFQKYVIKMNQLARSEGFHGLSEMWFYAFDDENFLTTVHDLWYDVKPLYDVLHEYAMTKLKIFYKESYKGENKYIPAHLLGNLWGQEWQAIYSKLVPYPDHYRPRLTSNATVTPKYLLDVVDEFHQSLGFESAKESYVDIEESSIESHCLSSSHDMCDGINYRLRWCGEITDVNVGLSRAAKLLSQIQYFEHYRNLSLIFRDGPNPAFRDALSDVFALQLTNPIYLKTLNNFEVDTSPEANLNYLLWVALEKIPLMAYAHVLDQWRWDVFNADNEVAENEKWNEHWWELRKEETGVGAPVPRNESDLDPASKYHVVSHIQYITYLISHALEFQILLSLCKLANHTGPLHECSIFGNKEAGSQLSTAMSLGASEDWRTILKMLTNETRLSVEALLEYFSPLETFLKDETIRLNALRKEEMDQSAPIIVGVIIVSLTVMIIALYCTKRLNLRNKISSFCAYGRNGSHDRETTIQMQGKTNDTEGASEPKI